MSVDKLQKISIGFHGGQVLAARVSHDDFRRLREALGSGGWHDLAAEDGTIVLDLSRIDYVLVDRDEHRVGF
jgi:hypothetical protein